MGVCVPNFRSVSFFVWPGDVTHINKQIHKHTYTSEIRNILDRMLTGILKKMGLHFMCWIKSFVATLKKEPMIGVLVQ